MTKTMLCRCAKAQIPNQDSGQARSGEVPATDMKLNFEYFQNTQFSELKI